MKILITQETNWVERGPHQQHHLVERLIKLKHKVRVIDYDFLWNQRKGIGISKTDRRSVVGKIVDNINVELNTPWMIKFPLLNRLSVVPSHTMSIIKEIKSFKPDIIINFGILNATISTVLGKLFKIPVVYYLIDHLHLLLENKILEKIAIIFEKYNMKNSNALFAINQGLIDYANLLTNNRTPDKIALIKGGVDYKIYDDASKHKSRIRRKLGIPDEAKVLFFMGWLYSFSRLDQIARQMVSNFKDEQIYLVVVGEGDLFEELNRIKYTSQDKRIILTGKVPFHEIPKYIACSDFCLLPSERNHIMENIVPIKLYEYLSSGKPVISTFLPGVYKEFGKNSGIIYIREVSEIFDIIKSSMRRMKTLALQASQTGKNSDWSKRVDQFQKELIDIVERN